MTLNQVVEILQKLDYDEGVKSKLIKKLRGGLYDTYASFLSNPLLVTIMMLTYDHSAEIPTRLSLFYNTAFEYLYQRHDATKGTFKRELYAQMPMDEFERVFSTFCYRSYINSIHEFSDTEIIKLLRDSLIYNQIDNNPELMAKDCSESACLIQRDGLYNVFTHRSFQEYFSAIFISRFQGAGLRSVVDNALRLGPTENVIGLLFEIDRERLEREYICPNFKEFLSKTRNLDLQNPRDLGKMSRLFSRKIGISAIDGAVARIWLLDNTVSEFSRILTNLYPEAISLTSLAFKNSDPIVEDFNLFLNKWKRNKNIERINSIRSRNKFHQENSRDIDLDPRLNEVDVSFHPTDCQWIIETNWPERLNDVRNEIDQFYSRLYRNIKRKDESIGLIFRKPTE